MIPAVSIQQLKDAWPEFKRQTTQARRNNPGLPHPLRVRCAILKRFLKLGTEPTELMFAVMAEMPIDEMFNNQPKAGAGPPRPLR
jgi:hypothetical protein